MAEVKGNLLVKDKLTVKGNSTFEKGLDSSYLELVDEKSKTVHGGTFNTPGWKTRDFTTVIHNDFATDVTPAADPGDGAQFTIPAGDYYIDASAPAFSVDEHMARLADVTDAAGELGATVVLGTSEFAADATQWSDSVPAPMTVSTSTQSRSNVEGRFSVTRSSILELQHRAHRTKATDGFGSRGNFYLTNNVYSTLKMWQLKAA
jgi:hypothetical protein